MKFRRSIPIFLLNHNFNFTHNITRCYLEEKRTVEREDLKVSCRFEIFWNFQITRPIREVKKKKKSVRIVRTCLKSGKALRGNQRALRNGERGEFSIISLRRVWNSGSLEGSGKRKKKRKREQHGGAEAQRNKLVKQAAKKEPVVILWSKPALGFTVTHRDSPLDSLGERNGKHCFTLTPKLVRPVSRYQRIGSQCDTRPPSNSNCRISRPAIPPLISHFIIVRKKYGG